MNSSPLDQLLLYLDDRAGHSRDSENQPIYRHTARLLDARDVVDQSPADDQFGSKVITPEAAEGMGGWQALLGRVEAWIYTVIVGHAPS